MIKMAGASLIIAATSLWGMLAADRVRNQSAQMQYLKKIIYRLRSETLYARAFLSEAFRNIAETSEEPYSGWPLFMSQELEQRQGVRFSQVWETGTLQKLKTADLPEPVCQRLLGLGGQLGNADVEMQVRILDLFLEELEHTMEEMREEQKSKIKLYHCMGVMSGIFLTILLI